MNLSAGFIRRPVATTLITFAIVTFGALSYRLLPVSDLPMVDFPTIQVSAGLPGASPETMAAAVATPLEKQFSAIAGIDSMISSSSMGSTNITLQFSLDRDIDAAAQDVQAAIAKTQRSLPADMPAPPSYQKVNPADAPVLFLALTSDTLPLSDVHRYAETTIGQRLSMVNGVALVSIMGAQKYAVRIDVDPRALASRQIGIDQVATSIGQANANRATGTLQGAERTFVIDTDGQLSKAEDYRQIIVAFRNGAPVRLDAVAHVYDGVENDKNAGWYNDARAITLSIQRQPGANTVAVVDAIRELLPQLQAQLPPSVQIVPRNDRSIPIRDSVHDVELTLLLTMALVVVVIFAFLRNVSATLIPGVAIPISIVGTFAVMYLLGYSLDNLSLMALTLSVGFVVDDAIVMLENIVRHMEMGATPMAAALEGAREIAFTILSMTVSLAAVFIPILFMQGIVGRLMKEFAVTIAVAILVSGLVAVTLTPMLCSRFLKPPHDARRGRLYRLSERAFDTLQHAYAWSLRLTLRHRAAVMLLSAGLTVATAYLFVIVPKGFIPSQDTGQISAQTEGMQGIGFDAMVAHQQQVAAIVAGDPNVRAYTSTVNGGNTGQMNIELKPRADRALDADAVIEELRPKLAHVAGIRVYLQNPPAIRIGGRGRSLYQYTLQGPDTAQLYELAPRVEARLRTLPQLEDVSTDLQIANPQLHVKLDRNQIAALGLTVDQVESALYDAYGAREVSSIFAPDNEYSVIMQVAPTFQRDANALSMLYLTGPGGQAIALSTVATIAPGAGPLQVNHTGQLPSVTLSFNLANGASLGDAVTAVDAAARAVLPASISGTFQGTAQAFQASFQGLGWVLLLAIVVIYIVLGVLYESFIHPLTILSGLPSAGFGALVTLLVFGASLDLYAFVGVIMLVGLVKKNGIMMVDFAIEAQRADGRPALQAIYDACLVRFRPIMMTTMAALVGTLPIALGWGAGAEVRRPLGLAVVGGLLVSQTLTLYITPVFYTWMDALRPATSSAASPVAASVASLAS